MGEGRGPWPLTASGLVSTQKAQASGSPESPEISTPAQRRVLQGDVLFVGPGMGGGQNVCVCVGGLQFFFFYSADDIPGSIISVSFLC